MTSLFKGQPLTCAGYTSLQHLTDSTPDFGKEKIRMKLAAAVALCALVTMATGFGYHDDYGYGGYPGNLYSSYSYLPYRNIGFGSYGSHGNAYGVRGHSYGLYGDSYSPYGNSYGRSRPSYNKYGFGYGLSLRRTPYNVRRYW